MYPTHEALVSDLKLLREKGLRRLRQLELDALRQAAHLVTGDANDDAPAAIEVTLRNAIARLDGGAYGESASWLFGLKEGTRARSPRVRREHAALALERSADTFRKNYEPGMLGEIASQILQLVVERESPRSRARTAAGTTTPLHSHGIAASSPLDPEVERQALMSLLEQFVPGRGFRSQPYGEDAYSLASTGACTRTLCLSDVIAEADKRAMLGFICDSIREDGTLPTHRYQDRWLETTWAAGQCLLALTTSPRMVDTSKARGLARTLIRYQSDLGWTLRPSEEPHLEPMYCLYPLMALVRARRHGWITQQELDRCLERLRGPMQGEVQSPKHPVRRILAEYELDVITTELGLAPTILRLPAGTGGKSLADPETFSRLGDHIIYARDQPLWYSRTWRPSLYLSVRRLYPLPAPITVLLGAELLEGYLPQEKGWQPDPEHDDNHPRRAFTWTTGLGLLATSRLRSDLAVSGIDQAGWERIVNDARRMAWRT